MNIFSFFNEVGFFDFLDILVMTFFIFTVLVWFKRTRAAFVLTGILIVAGFYLLARQFNLILTASVFQAFFAVILVAVVVIFQEELRHFFERVAVLGLQSRFGSKKSSNLPTAEVAILVRSLSDFAKERIGVLIVIRGKDMILRHLEGGEELNGVLSEALLKSLFDPHSLGHDGAMIIEGNTVSRFGCHLPLSKNFRLLGDRGTRHAAALGLSELSDSLSLIVSEEKGTVSYARHGELCPVPDPESLNALLDSFYQEIFPRPLPATWRDFFKRNLKEKLIALTCASLLWFLHVYGSKTIDRGFQIPIEYPELPKSLVLAEMDPKSVLVTFSAPRRAFYFLTKEEIHLTLKTWQLNEGVDSVRISSSDITVPKHFVIENIAPRKVKVRIDKKMDY